MRSALRRPCFVDFCGPSMLAVTNRWDIGRVHLLNVETSSVETSCGSFGGPHDAEETDQELNEPRGVCFDSGSGSGSGSKDSSSAVGDRRGGRRLASLRL